MSADRWQDREVGLTVLLLAMLATVAIDAWAVVVLWRWFLVPAGMAAISMRTAVGVDLIANLIHRQSAAGVAPTWSNLINRVVLVPALCMGVGLLFRWWLS